MISGIHDSGMPVGGGERERGLPPIPGEGQEGLDGNSCLPGVRGHGGP